MRSAQEHAAINRMLRSHGLGSLEDGAGLMAQLGFMVQDHEHLRSLLVRCEPENRSAMYDSLRPYLRFTAKPLDVYIAESAEKAAREDLPTYDADGKINFQPSVTANITGEQAAAQAAVNEAFAKQHLTLTCRSCTKQETFSGASKADAVHAARSAGWVYYEREGKEPAEICPDCPAVRAVN